MFRGCCGVTLASMSQTDWSDVGMTDQLPTGMATLLLADVEGSTRLWESQSKEMAEQLAQQASRH
jgi:class 3 adenylate cyclase